MNRKFFNHWIYARVFTIYCLVLAAVVFADGVKAASPFLIGTNLWHSQTGGVAFDGSNYLVGLQASTGDASAPAAQFVSPSGTLIGPGIVLSATSDPPFVTFDGTNYLLSWADHSSGPGVPLRGQFINRTGSAFGSFFQIGQSTTLRQEAAAAFDGTNYFLIWGDTNGLHGQFLSRSGVNVGAGFYIGGNSNTTTAGAAFDGTNYLVAWPVNGSGIYGQLYSRAGAQVGSQIVIDGDTNTSMGALPNVFFDGARFIVSFAEGTNIQTLVVLARMVTTSGTALTNQITIGADPGGLLAPSVAFDGANYLVACLNGFPSTTTNGSINGRFFNYTWTLLGPEFNILSAQGTNLPSFPSVVFDGTKYLAVGGLGGYATNEGNFATNSGTAYGVLIPSSAALPQLAAGAPLTNGQFTVQLTGTPGINYAIQYTTNVAVSNWTALVTNSPTNGSFSFTDTNATKTSRFYRAAMQ